MARNTFCGLAKPLLLKGEAGKFLVFQFTQRDNNLMLPSPVLFLWKKRPLAGGVSKVGEWFVPRKLAKVAFLAGNQAPTVFISRHKSKTFKNRDFLCLIFISKACLDFCTISFLVVA